MSGPAPDLYLSPGPHIRRGRTTAEIMWLVNLSLAPALVWAVLVFGWPVLGITVSAVLGCALAEQLACLVRRAPSTLPDGSVVCTGLLLAYTLPPGMPLWMPFVGGALGVFFAKTVFGGLGYNVFNIALVARALMMATFPVEMTTAWVEPDFGALAAVDALSGATPLVSLTGGGEAAGAAIVGTPEGMAHGLAFFLGLRPGSIGEVSVLLIGLGAAFLLWQRIIKLWIPASVIAGAALLAPWSPDPVLYLLSGGLWLGAFFMATDYVTSPSTPKGQVVFGLGIGLLTGMIRNWGGYPEGICYAILLMNTLTPALEEWFRPPRSAAKGTPS
ncbi:MAG TPA: RnfABCDGE type electron transport complex subunit D [Gammaproteobacteria bacterium]